MDNGPFDAGHTEQRAIRKIFRRLVPFLLLLYLLAYIDRVNIGFAALHMNRDLGLTASMFGFASTAFFITYALFEIPSNILCARYGAHTWLPRIMITWGLASAATMFATGPESLYVLRAVIGAAEAGFVPGVIYYLSFWMPDAHKAKANGLFLAAVPLALTVGAPLSGAILQMDGTFGLAGWRWLFLIEGVPAVVLGVCAYFYLPAGPSHASWLTQEEKYAAQRAIEWESHPKAAGGKGGLSDLLPTLVAPGILSLIFCYFCIAASINTFSIWLPQIMSEFLSRTYSPGVIGTIAAIPTFIAVAFTLAASAHSDKTNERRLHVVALMLTAGVGWLMVWLGLGPLWKMAGLTLVAIGSFSAPGIFWAMTVRRLPKERQAVGIAAISTIGLFASVISPLVVGWLRDHTNSFNATFWYIAALLMLGALAALWQRPQVDTRDERSSLSGSLS